MAGWRDRLDRTTNWAVTVVAGMLSISLSNPTAHHGVILFAELIVLLLLFIESRRYRFFDLYRNRVRKMERNYFACVFDRATECDDTWLQRLSGDLRSPTFPIGRLDAFARRLRRNYIWMFLLLLAAWILKVTSADPLEDSLGPGSWLGSWPDPDRLPGFGSLSGWTVLAVVVAFHTALIACLFTPARSSPEVVAGNVHV